MQHLTTCPNRDTLVLHFSTKNCFFPRIISPNTNSHTLPLSMLIMTNEVVKDPCDISDEVDLQSSADPSTPEANDLPVLPCDI